MSLQYFLSCLEIVIAVVFFVKLCGVHLFSLPVYREYFHFVFLAVHCGLSLQHFSLSKGLCKVIFFLQKSEFARKWVGGSRSHSELFWKIFPK